MGEVRPAFIGRMASLLCQQERDVVFRMESTIGSYMAVAGMTRHLPHALGRKKEMSSGALHPLLLQEP